MRSWRTSHDRTRLLWLRLAAPHHLYGGKPYARRCSRLLSLNTGLILAVIAIIAMSTWGILHEMRKIGDISERVAGIAERLDARLRRQYADIDREL